MKTVIPGARPFFSAESRASILRRIDGILESGKLTMGPVAEEFESRFAAYVGVKHAVAVSSGAAALLLALQYFDLRGGEVIVPVETFVASANSVILAGGTPRLVNIEPRTLCLDLDDVRRSIGPKTRGVMVVHLAGQITPAIHEFQELTKQRGLFLIEDAAHAPGSTISGQKAGSLGDVGCFSLFATKVMTSGEGGVVTTDSDELADFVRSNRNHGQRKGTELYENVSLNYRMSEITAAVALEQFAHLEEFIERRNNIVVAYRAALAEVAEVEFLPSFPQTRSAFWKYFVRVSPSIDRDHLIEVMFGKYGVATYPPYDPLCHRQPVMARYVVDPERYRVSDEIMSHVICLPVFVGLTEDQVAYVVRSLKETLLESTRSR